MSRVFSHHQYLIRKKVFSVLGARLHIYDGSDNLVLYCQLKAFKLKEDISVYSDEDMRKELLRIKARQIVDFSSAYDVYDVETGETIGALQRRGIKSVFKDEWMMLDNQDREIGRIKEDSTVMALLRRFMPIIPQQYIIEIAGRTIPVFSRNFNPLVSKVTVDFTEDQKEVIDRRLGIAAGILLCVIEGKQD